MASIFLQEIIATGGRTQQSQHRQCTANYCFIDISHIIYYLLIFDLRFITSLEVHLQTNGEATVVECSTCIEVHEVNRRIEHTEVLTLDIDLGIAQADTQLAEQLLVEVVTQREVADLDERGILEAQQSCVGITTCLAVDWLLPLCTRI